MHGGKRDVDEIWRKLNQSQAGTNRSASFEKLWHGFSSDISTNAKASKSSRDTAEKAQQLKLDPAISRLVPQPKAEAKPDAHVPAAGPCLEGAALDRLAQSLQSTDVSTRRAALQQIQASFVTCSPPPAAEAAAEALSSKLGKGLLRRFEDQSEALRQLAVGTFKTLLQAGPDATLGLLPYAMPVLEERLHLSEAHDPTEPSEEIRLLLLQLLSAILDAAGSAVAAYASEVLSMLASGLADSYHEVAVQGCRAAQQLAGCLGMRLGPAAKDLVSGLLPLTTHKRHRVRIAAVEAVRDVMHQGAHEMILEMVAWRDPNMVPIKAFYGDDIKVNYCGKLATDHHTQVRLAFLDMIGNWLLTLRERTDHEARLLPYLLSGLCDDAPVVVEAALKLLDQLGLQYEQEHEKDVLDIVRFGGEAQGEAEGRLVSAVQQGRVVYGGGVQAAAGAGTGGVAGGAAAGGGDTGGGGAEGEGQAVFVLPGPFAARPRLGSRLLTRNNFSAALHALCHELSSWQSGPRAMSARLLAVNLALAESAAERHLQVLLPALCAAVRDADAGPAVADCAALLGCHCNLKLLLELLAPRVLDVAGDTKRQADALLVLAAALRGAGPVGRLRGHARQLTDLLSQQAIAGSQDSSMKAAATDVMQQLLVPQVLQQLLAESDDEAVLMAAEPASQQYGGSSGEITIQTCRSEFQYIVASIDDEEQCQQEQQEQQKQAYMAPSQLLVLLVQLLLQLGACERHFQADVAAARTQAAQMEQLLAGLAKTAGFESTDSLLACCRTQLLNKLCAGVGLDSAAAVSAVCGLMIPSSCGWILTSHPSQNVIHRQPLPAKYCSSSTGAPAAGVSDSTITGTCSSSSSTSGRQQGLLPFSPAAAEACCPEHLIRLLQLVTAAEQGCSKQLQQTTAHVHLLLATLDCCMQTWPAASFEAHVLQQLLQSTVPALLGSSRSLAAMAGLRTLHLLLLRQLANEREQGTDGREQQQQDVKDRALLDRLLLGSWQQHGMCQLVCQLLRSDDAAVRLEACHVLEVVLDVLGSDCIVAGNAAAPTAAAAAPTAAGPAPLPAAALLPTLDDADADVVAAARRALGQLAKVLEHSGVWRQQ